MISEKERKELPVSYWKVFDQAITQHPGLEPSITEDHNAFVHYYYNELGEDAEELMKKLMQEVDENLENIEYSDLLSYLEVKITGKLWKNKKFSA